MLNLFITNELYISGFKVEVLDIVSLFAIFCGVFTIISKNPIVSVLFLIGLFGGVSSYLILLGLNFIGLSYLIVYIGAVSILFLFILMLINIRISELQSNTRNSIALAVFITIFFNYAVFQMLPYNLAILNSPSNYLNSLLYYTFLNKEEFSNKKKIEMSDPDLYFATSNTWDGNLVESSHINSIGNILYTNYNIWLIMVSIILLLAMVGAIVITIKQKNKRD